MGWILLGVFVLIQFFRITKNQSSAVAVNSITTKFSVPSTVQSVLKTSCYNCHSNNTDYPWYVNLQPVAWWLQSHVMDGKKHLNFDEFAGYTLRRQYNKFDEIKEMVEKDEMPLGSYTLIHRDAILSKEQKELLINWSGQMMDTMKASYPPDSLKKQN